MRVLTGLGLALLLPAAGFAQGHGGIFNPQPTLQGGFGNVVFPAGTPHLYPGGPPSFGNVVFPAGGGPRLNIPVSGQFPGYSGSSFGRSPVGAYRHQRGSSIGALPYIVPVYVGDYSGYYDGAPVAPAPSAPQQPNVIVIYAPAPQPVVGDRAGASDFAAAPPQARLAEPAADSFAAEGPHFLIAFKDHTIYSAVAYWVEGETLHYFTTGNTHNQVSLGLVDRDLTERLNRESGSPVQLPR